MVVSDEVLTQCISEVREAIADRTQSMIKTMPRRGYRFAAPVSQHGGEVEARDRSTPAASFAHDTAAQLSGKPSIAVLPFVNLDNDPQQDYFGDGITGDIIIELSRFSELFVIARSSAFQYKGKAIDVRQVGRELGVRYVLEGSVRRDAQRIRITAELIDATNGAIAGRNVMTASSRMHSRCRTKSCAGLSRSCRSVWLRLKPSARC